MRAYVHIYIYIYVCVCAQGDSGAKVRILADDSMGYCEKVSFL